MMSLTHDQANVSSLKSKDSHKVLDAHAGERELSASSPLSGSAELPSRVLCQLPRRSGHSRCSAPWLGSGPSSTTADCPTGFMASSNTRLSSRSAADRRSGVSSVGQNQGVSGASVPPEGNPISSSFPASRAPFRASPDSWPPPSTFKASKAGPCFRLPPPSHQGTSFRLRPGPAWIASPFQDSSLNPNCK